MSESIEQNEESHFDQVEAFFTDGNQEEEQETLVFDENQSNTNLDPTASNDNQLDQQENQTNSKDDSNINIEDLPVVAKLKSANKAPEIERVQKILESVQRQSKPIEQSFSESLEHLSYDKIVGNLNIDDYWKRVETFSIYNWFGKPLKLSPLECSRFGWKNLKEDVLQCNLCKKQLIWNNPDPKDLYNYVETFSKLLTTTHHVNCEFYSKTCDSSFYSIKNQSSAIIHGFYQRNDNLVQIINKVNAYGPLKVDISQIQAFLKSNGIDLNEISLKCFNNKTKFSSENLQKIFVVSICGWIPIEPTDLTETKKRKTNSSNIEIELKCNYCRRKVILGSETEDDQTSASKRSKPTEGHPASFSTLNLHESPLLDPIGDHHMYCPWVCLVEDEKFVGWQIVLRNVIQSIQSSVRHVEPLSSDEDEE